jgi:hypothetical protein
MELENPIVITPSLSMVPKWKFHELSKKDFIIVNPGIIIALAFLSKVVASYSSKSKMD